MILLLILMVQSRSIELLQASNNNESEKRLKKDTYLK